MTRVTCVLAAIITLEELSQAFISTRSCDPLDWLADMAGLAIGQIAANACRTRFRHSSPSTFP